MTHAEDLKRQLDAAYTAIQELDEDLAAGRLSAADHAELKTRSERHAAGLLARLREVEHGSDGRAARSRVAQPALGARLRSPLALAIAAAALLFFGVVLGVLIARFTGDDAAVASTGTPPAGAGPSPGMAGIPPAGGPAGQGGAGGQAVSPALAALQKQVEAENAPIATLLEFANLALDEGHVPAAIWGYKRVLAREPKNVQAITKIGMILAQGNHVDGALKRLDEAIAIDPRYAPAHSSRAQVLFHGKQDYRAAMASLETYLKLAPKGADAERARTMLAEARKLAASTAAPGR
jgi:tetratricopeptide (TPR) repeat protein